MVRLLLSGWSPGGGIDVRLPADLDALRLKFWNHTIVQVVMLVREQLAAARVALAACTALVDPTAFEGWLDRIEGGANQAIHHRMQTKQFMARYQRINEPTAHTTVAIEPLS